MYVRTGFAGRARKTEGVVEWMQVTAVGIVQTACIAGRIHEAVHGVLLDDAEAVVAEIPGSLIAPDAQFIQLSRLVCSRQISERQFAIDTMPLDAPRHDVKRLAPEFPHELDVCQR